METQSHIRWLVAVDLEYWAAIIDGLILKHWFKMKTIFVIGSFQLLLLIRWRNMTLIKMWQAFYEKLYTSLFIIYLLSLFTFFVLYKTYFAELILHYKIHVVT